MVENAHKIKLLILMELLRQETDEENPMLAGEICRRLVKQNISCNRRTLTRDIRTLNEFGFEIMEKLIGHEKAYYVEDRIFSDPEIKLLLDAIQAAAFLTPKKTQELSEKLASLGGTRKGELLKRNSVVFTGRKHTNELIFYTIGTLENAIRKKNKTCFYYFDLNEKGEKVLRKEGMRYEVDPVALVLDEDNYYLVAYSKEHKEKRTYRLDRMLHVEMTEEPIGKEALALYDDTVPYKEQTIKMYGGRVCDVTLGFDKTLIGVIYDRFGEETTIMPMKGNVCSATVTVQVSPTFWGWLFQFAGQMKILSPATMVEESKNQVRRLQESFFAAGGGEE